MPDKKIKIIGSSNFTIIKTEDTYTTIVPTNPTEEEFMEATHLKIKGTVKTFVWPWN